MGSSSIFLLIKALILNISNLDSNSRGIFLKYLDLLEGLKIKADNLKTSPQQDYQQRMFHLFIYSDKNYPLFSPRMF